ncbi:MAG TPA: hypothetical protein VFI57_01845 [Pyrinomonadaceae bacterium]|nr:hypothetical protein [Pyrinomonadaceae bacterium]
MPQRSWAGINLSQVRCAARFALKQSLHKTGLPDEGLKGTESFLPHWSHVISNRWRSPVCPLPPPKLARRASRHGLQRFG